MAKVFNVTAVCMPEKHYMVDIQKRLCEIKKQIDAGYYFTINRARQYGKTTTLRALNKYLQQDYYVISMDFQTFDAGKFKDSNIFSITFAKAFVRIIMRNAIDSESQLKNAITQLSEEIKNNKSDFALTELFECLSDICAYADKPIILLIDEVDSASNNQVFLDFLAQLRAYYIDRDVRPTFQSVILAGVYDIKNLKRKLRSDENHKLNSPWNTRESNEENEYLYSFDDCTRDYREPAPYNIAADFDIDMSLSKSGIEGMLREYENDYHTGMQIEQIASLLYDYTSGYPFLVSRLCKLIDEEISKETYCGNKNTAWTKAGFHEALKILLSEKNTLFESLIGKLTEYRELNEMIKSLLFTGKNIAYNPDASEIDMAMMFGFIKKDQGNVLIANRIFETRLYNYYLFDADMQNQDIYKASLKDKNQFLNEGHLDMHLVLEKFVVHFNDLYGNCDEAFLEEEGRKYFLLYLRPIINGTGNYYIESRTRSMGRTDVIVDYNGEQFIIEMKIWHGLEYNNRGEKQLIGYLNDYHIDKGYMVSFNFNQQKEIGVRTLTIGDKILIEAIC